MLLDDENIVKMWRDICSRWLHEQPTLDVLEHLTAAWGQGYCQNVARLSPSWSFGSKQTAESVPPIDAKALWNCVESCGSPQAWLANSHLVEFHEVIDKDSL